MVVAATTAAALPLTPGIVAARREAASRGGIGTENIGIKWKTVAEIKSS